MENKRYYVKKAKIRDYENPNDFLTVDEVCERLNLQNKKIIELTEMIDKYQDDNRRYSLEVEEQIVPEYPRYVGTGCSTEIKDTYTNRFFWLELPENVEEVRRILNDYQAN